MQRFAYKIFKINVPATGEQPVARFQLDETVKKVVGLALSSNRTDALFVRGTHQLSIGGSEVHPKEYDSKMLMSGITVAPDAKYQAVDLEPGNSVIDFRYTDNAVAAPAFPNGGYTVRLLVKVQL